jgi:ABC-type multidrug transport system ATPase subunit
MVIISHDLEIVDYCTRVCLLEEGRVSQFGTPEELIASLPGAGECLRLTLRTMSPALIERVTSISSVKYTADAGRNAMKLFIDNPHDNMLPIMETLNEMKIPFDEVSIVEADFFDYFAVKPWKYEQSGGIAQ